MINKSATKACEILWANGNETVFWVGHNSNTGATIVWQRVRYGAKLGKSTRITGRNIAKLAAEIAAIEPWEATFTYRNAAAMAAIN